MRTQSKRILRVGLIAASLATPSAGCGIAERPADLFVLTRAGPGKSLTLLVRDDGSIACDGHAGKQLSDAQILVARDLQSSLDSDAKKGLKIAPGAGSVYSYKVKLQDGTISFPDTAGAGRKELAQVQLFALQVAQSLCS